MDDAGMDDAAFDRALIAAGFEAAARSGWTRFVMAEAAREAGLDMARARGRIPDRAALLMRFGRLADQAALTGATTEGPVRDRLFDLLMRRIDVLQSHRAGMLALLRALPCEPPTALALAALNLRSMVWMLEGAGVSASGLRGLLRAKGLMGVWLWTVRAWQRDGSEDLSATMAALDHALARAARAEEWLGHRRIAPPPPEMPDNPPGNPPQGPEPGPAPAGHDSPPAPPVSGPEAQEPPPMPDAHPPASGPIVPPPIRPD
jgi:ubiquinone biosynthesis protein COQ9